MTEAIGATLEDNYQFKDVEMIESRDMPVRFVPIVHRNSNAYFAIMNRRHFGDLRLKKDDTFKIILPAKCGLPEEAWTAIVMETAPFVDPSDICCYVHSRHEGDGGFSSSDIGGVVEPTNHQLNNIQEALAHTEPEDVRVKLDTSHLPLR